MNYKWERKRAAPDGESCLPLKPTARTFVSDGMSVMSFARPGVSTTDVGGIALYRSTPPCTSLSSGSAVCRTRACHCRYLVDCSANTVQGV